MRYLSTVTLAEKRDSHCLVRVLTRFIVVVEPSYQMNVNECLTKGVMQKCNVSDDVECVGEANTNFVYEIKEKGESLF